MTSPWLLVVAGGATVGALFGVIGVALWTAGVAIASLAGRRGWLALVIAAAIGAGCGAARVAIDAVPPVPAATLASHEAEVVVTSIPQTGPSGPRAVVAVERVQDSAGAWQPGSGKVLVLFRDHAPEALSKGDRLRIRWSVRDVGGSDFGRFVRSAGAGASASAFHVDVLSRGRSVATTMTRTRELVSRRLVEAIPGNAGALMAGFVTGDDSGLSDTMQEAFERAGMAHITAVSGSNVAVLLTIWFFFMPSGRLRRSLPALAGVTAVIWLYVVLVGLGPGAVRAGLFATILLPAARIGRRPDPLTGLMLASAAMLLVRPGYAHNVGFWLSLAASTAIVTCLRRDAAGVGGRMMSGAVALVAAQVATLPIIVWTFGGWSPTSLAANLIVGPVVSAFFPFSFVTALLVTVLPWLGGPIGRPPAIVADVILAIVQSLADEASTLRLGTATPVAIALVGALSLTVIALLSVDARRWLARIAWRVPGAGVTVPALAIGAGVGAWAAVVLRVLMR